MTHGNSHILVITHKLNLNNTITQITFNISIKSINHHMISRSTLGNRETTPLLGIKENAPH